MAGRTGSRARPAAYRFARALSRARRAKVTRQGIETVFFLDGGRADIVATPFDIPRLELGVRVRDAFLQQVNR